MASWSHPKTFLTTRISCGLALGAHKPTKISSSYSPKRRPPLIVGPTPDYKSLKPNGPMLKAWGQLACLDCFEESLASFCTGSLARLLQIDTLTDLPEPASKIKMHTSIEAWRVRRVHDLPPNGVQPIFSRLAILLQPSLDFLNWGS